MKLLHTSDWHLGISVGPWTEEENQQYFFQQLYEIVEREGVGAVLVSGDVYDSSVSNADAIRLYNQVTTELCGKRKTSLIIIAGNHDSAVRLATCRELLSSAGLYVYGRLPKDVEPVLLDNGKVAVYPLPFFNRDEVAALFPEKAKEIRTQEQAMETVCNRIRTVMRPDCFNIIMSHALVVNAQLSESDRSARIGNTTAVSAEVFRGFSYAALGHIHKEQSITPAVRYSGSPIRYAFVREETQEKGVILLDTDTGEQRFLPIVPRRNRKTVEGTLEELMKRQDLADKYLCLTVTDRYAGLELMAQLRQKFPYLVELSGKSLTGETETSTLSLETLQKLDDMELICQFFEENAGFVPAERHKQIFQEILVRMEEASET